MAEATSTAIKPVKRASSGRPNTLALLLNNTLATAGLVVFGLIVLIALAAPFLRLGVFLAEIGDLLVPDRNRGIRVAIFHGLVEAFMLGDDQFPLAKAEDKKIGYRLQ